ncbi:uncharacterized protein LOC136065259 [Quercus suber]|uniref:uncharacterized protein LOC136065259 n=1 Tax=Quercus suber TaxID=58331 RepID=UPI0032DFF4A4
MTNHPLKKAMNKLEAAGRLIQWAVELSEFDIKYQPRHAIKAQALADFIAEFTLNYDNYQATNNEVEYEALLKGLELAKSVEAKLILVLGDSQLIMDQVNGMYEAKEERMRRYLSRVMRLMRKFEEVNFVQIPREENIKADALAKEVLANEAVDKFDEIQFGVPRVLISDNGRQFDNALFKDFCMHFGIQNHYSSPAHPQANGQVEVANRSLLKIIKTRLEGAKGVWPDELPGVLWAYKTIVRIPTGETPFKLAYGTEAVIPAEVHMANHKVTTYHDKDNEE